RGVVRDAEDIAVGIVGVDGLRAVAHSLLDQPAAPVIAVLDNRVAGPVRQLREPAEAVINVVDREARLIDALRALADAVVGELERGAFGVIDLGEQVGIVGVAIEKVGDLALGVGRTGKVALGAVGIGVRGAVSKGFRGDKPLGVVRKANRLAA